MTNKEKRGFFAKIFGTKNKPVTPEEKKSVLTTFIMLFPAMLISVLTALYAPREISLITVALFFYQAILLKNFVDDHYNTV